MIKPMHMILLFVMAILCMSLIYIISENYQAKHFSCNSESVLKGDQHSTAVSIKFIFDGTQGGTIIEGVNHDSKGVVHPFRRHTTFSFTRSGNEYTMTTRSATSLAGDTSDEKLVALSFPSFFISEGHTVRLTRYNQGDGGYVFMNGETLMSYCKR